MVKRAAKSKSKKRAGKKPAAKRRRFRPIVWGMRVMGGLLALSMVLVALGRFINPPTTVYMLQEQRRLGGITRTWVPIDDVAPAMARSVVAAEDANYCKHWGFDLAAIKRAIDEGGERGASTISQQTVKNVYLWHGRTYTRKAIEALLTPLVEALWSKRRIIEVYLNVAEFDEGVFGVDAAARHYFNVSAGQLSDVQAARLAAILPSPKTRSASKPSPSVRKRSKQVLDGAATISKDGRAACFES
ncbi:MAG: monofunctional biosynthetic peptidoglycan transglycosylase [Sulfitobacter sp.]